MNDDQTLINLDRLLDIRRRLHAFGLKFNLYKDPQGYRWNVEISYNTRWIGKTMWFATIGETLERAEYQLQRWGI